MRKKRMYGNCHSILRLDMNDRQVQRAASGLGCPFMRASQGTSGDGIHCRINTTENRISI